mgnify:FL=1
MPVRCARVVRSEAARTAFPGRDGKRAKHLLNRNLCKNAPNKVSIADFTYVRTWAEFAHAAFVVDPYGRKVVAGRRQQPRTPRWLKSLTHADLDASQQGHRLRPGPYPAQEDKTTFHSDYAEENTKPRTGVLAWSGGVLSA